MRHNDLCAFRQVRCVDGLAVLRVRRNQAQFGAGVAALVWRDATALLLERKIEQRCDLGPQPPIEVHEDGLRDDARPQPQKDLEHCDHQQRSDYRRGCVGEPPLHLIRDSRCILAVLRWRYQGGKGDRVDRSTGVMSALALRAEPELRPVTAEAAEAPPFRRSTDVHSDVRDPAEGHAGVERQRSVVASGSRFRRPPLSAVGILLAWREATVSRSHASLFRNAKQIRG